jgi:hypothetical protein
VKNVWWPLIPAALISVSAWAGAVASIYNGEQYHLNGAVLVQDADHPDDFFILPTRYHLKTKSHVDDQGRLVTAQSARNTVVRINGHDYSSYAMTFELDEPGKLEMLRATQALRQQVGRPARIKGLVPICGLRLAVPGFKESGPSGDNRLNPDSPLLRYSISSTEADKCASIIDTSEFNMEYRVPIGLEPEAAKEITSDVGMTLPPIEIVLPYKYKDHVTVKIEAQSTINQLRAGGDFAGSFKMVTLQVKASIETLFNRLAVTGGLDVDCQNPDRKICDGFVEQAKDILAKTLFLYTANADKGDTNPLVLADNDKAVSTGGFKATLGIDSQSATREGYFRVDFSSTAYSSITSQAQVTAKNISRRYLDPQILKLLNERYPEQKDETPTTLNFRMGL